MGWLSTYKQQPKAKMLAAGATQALRLFGNPLSEIIIKMVNTNQIFWGGEEIETFKHCY
jgi:hypothetical protein